MKSDVNITILTGRLTRNPELRKTPLGVIVCDLRLASNKYSQDKQFTTFTRITVWNKQAEFFAGEHGVKTGDLIHVQGMLVDDNFETEKGDPSSRTNGRLKIDHADIKILARKKIETQAE